MPDPKTITETTTLAELREQRILFEVLSLRFYPTTNVGGQAAVIQHATGLYRGLGPTEAAAIEAAFAKLRLALLPEPIKRYGAQ